VRLKFLPHHEVEGKSGDLLLSELVSGIEQRIRQNPGRWWQWQALPMFWGEV
jgi:hypothetical protein